MYVCQAVSVRLCVELTMRGSKIGVKSWRFVSMREGLLFVCLNQWQKY